MLLSRRKVIVGFIAAIVIAAAAVVALDRTGTFDLLPDALDELLPSEDENAAATFAGGPDQLLYLSGTALELRSIEAQENERVTELPTRDAVASPGSHHVAYVVSESAGDTTQPTLHLLNTEAGDDEAVGPGIAPEWQPRGTRVAYLEPTEPTGCTTVACPGATAVVAMDPESREKETLLDGGAWAIVGWAGDYLLVADEENPNVTTAVSNDADRKTLDVTPAEIVDPSPDGRWLLTQTEEGIELLELEDGAAAGAPTEIDLGGRTMIGGSWAHDSSLFAAVVAQPGTATKRVPEFSEVVVFDPADPDPRAIEESFGATGVVLWAVDAESVVFPRLVDPQSGLVQASFCPIAVGGGEGCRILFSWTGIQVNLLRMQ